MCPDLRERRARGHERITEGVNPIVRAHGWWSRFGYRRAKRAEADIRRVSALQGLMTNSQAREYDQASQRGRVPQTILKEIEDIGGGGQKDRGTTGKERARRSRLRSTQGKGAEVGVGGQAPEGRV